MFCSKLDCGFWTSSNFKLFTHKTNCGCTNHAILMESECVFHIAGEIYLYTVCSFGMRAWHTCQQWQLLPNNTWICTDAISNKRQREAINFTVHDYTNCCIFAFRMIMIHSPPKQSFWYLILHSDLPLLLIQPVILLHLPVTCCRLQTHTHSSATVHCHNPRMSFERKRRINPHSTYPNGWKHIYIN